jgi:hypothetical protein
MDHSNSDIASIAASYLRYSNSLSRDEDPDAVWSPETDPDCRDYHTVDDAIRRGPTDLAWRLVRAILDATDDDDLAHQAAGPLEEVVRLRGSDLIASIERDATQDPRFRWALGQIWLSEGELPRDILARVVAASGDTIHVFTKAELSSGSNEPPPNER